MKKPNSPLILPLAALCGMVASSQAATIINDTWLDGTRNDPGTYSENGVDADLDGNIESAWYGTTLTAGTGSLTGTVGGGSSSWTTYLTPAGSTLTLANAGDQLRVRWMFTPTGVNSADVGQSFRLALVNSEAVARLSADGTPASGAYLGYAMFMNMNTTLGNGNSFQLRERTGTAAILANASEWNASLANGAGSGTPGYTSGTAYTFEMLLTRTALNGLQIDATMTGAGLGAGNQGFLAVSHTDATPNTFEFDMFHIRPSSGAATATTFTTTGFSVEIIPEPSSFALAGLGVLGLLLHRRKP